MDIGQLRTFLLIVDEGSFARAGEAMHRSTSSVSRSIKELERSLGALLFLRTHRQVELTEAGRALVDPARQLVRGFDALPQVLRDHLAARRNELRAGVCVGAPTVPLDTFRDVLDRAGSGVAYTVGTSATLMAAVSEGELDVAVAHLPVLGPDLAAVPLLRYEWQVAMPAGHPLAGRDRLTLEDLSGQTVVIQPHVVQPLSVERLARRLSAAGATPEPSSGGEGMRAAHLVRLGGRVALVPAARLGGMGKLFEGPEFALATLDDPLPEWTLGLVHRAATDPEELRPGLLAALTAAFRDLAERCGLDRSAALPG